METRYQQMTKGGIDGYSNFMGDDSEYRDWYGILGRSRDSSQLELSNFEKGLELLGGEGKNVRVERYGHWAVGWIEEVYVRPNTKEYEIACNIEKRLEDYPVLDEDDFSQKEYNEANRVWSDCYNWADRTEYIRKNRSQFDFSNFKDLFNCVKGKYFAGYASELIG